MTEYAELLKLPAKIVIAVVLILFISQLIGAIASIKSNAVPGILTIYKHAKKGKQRREMIDNFPNTLDSIIEKLDALTTTVGEVKKTTDETKADLAETKLKLDVNTNMTEESRSRLDVIEKAQLNSKIETLRNRYLNFASTCTTSACTREQFVKMDKIYEEYERIIEENGMLNHEMDFSHSLILEEWDRRIREHDFLEYQHGYLKK